MIVKFPEYETENELTFQRFGTSFSTLEQYNCVCCGRRVSIEDSVSCQGKHLMCCSCADSNFKSRLEMFDYFETLR